MEVTKIYISINPTFSFKNIVKEFYLINYLAIDITILKETIN